MVGLGVGSDVSCAEDGIPHTTQKGSHCGRWTRTSGSWLQPLGDLVVRGIGLVDLHVSFLGLSQLAVPPPQSKPNVNGMRGFQSMPRQPIATDGMECFPYHQR